MRTPADAGRAAGISRRPAPRLRALVGALAVLALTGCAPMTASPAGADHQEQVELLPLAELDLLQDPKAYQGESTATLYDSGIEAIAASPEPALPVAVDSFERGGARRVQVTDAARVIGLSMTGNIAATVAALGLGDRLVGRDVATTFPGAAELPAVTRAGHALDLEAVLALNPSLVITDGSIGPLDVVLQLRDAGVALVFVEREASIEGVYRTTRQVAAALGVPELGERLAERQRGEIEAKLAEIAAIAPEGEQRLRMAFLYLRGGSGVFYLFGADTGSTVLIEALGGIDPSAEIGWVGAKPMTDEALIAINPDLILVMSDGIASAGGVDGLIAEKPAVGLTNAGLHRRFVDMADTEILAFGPRTAAILDALARAVYSPEDQGVRRADPR